MPPSTYFRDLKFILGRIRTPERLDDHPWTHSLTVQAAVKACPSLEGKSPGVQLIRALADLFRQMQPPTPPQDGKRLDTRWGRFGILAANYFAPLLYGRLYPRSLLEAWRRIDSAILLFVHGKPADELTPEQVSAYRFITDELDFPAGSTISDWHRSGLQDLADLFASREQSLSLAAGVAPTAARPKAIPRAAGYVLLAAILIALGLLAADAYRIYQRLQAVRTDIAAVQALPLTSLQPDTLNAAAGLLKQTHADLALLRTDAAPWLGLTPHLGWVPIYGGDLQSATDLLDMASDATGAAQQASETALPIWDALHKDGDVRLSDLTRLLLDTRPKLLEAQATLADARAARQRIPADRLSPVSRGLLDRLDPYLSTLDESLSLALAMPELLGGTQTGPKTYLILVENEDELRPTGGFITAVGKVVVYNGQLVDLSVADSYSVDDIQKAYPAAPWQMRAFMNIPIMTFRDASWFTDYPTAARWAEYLYAYTNSYSVDGVIALDQNVMASLLAVTGPVYVPEIHTSVTAANLRTVMRAQKVPPPPDQRDADWHRKQFMNPIASAILGRMVSGHGMAWEQLLKAMVKQLDQRHILAQLDDPVLTKLLADRGWDGALRNTAGDFLMVVDTNVGYNKTNAVVNSTLTYDVDLTDPAAPKANLLVSHTNRAVGDAGPCNQKPAETETARWERWYPIDRCYYDYLRIYLPAGAKYSGGNLQAVTREEMVMLEQDVPPRVDELDEEIAGIQGYGTLLVVPMGHTVGTSLQFTLPAAILQSDPATGEQIYHLKIQKQAGVQAMPLTVRLHLPTGAQITSSNEEFLATGSNLLFELTVDTDAEIQIQFNP